MINKTRSEKMKKMVIAIAFSGMILTVANAAIIRNEFDTSLTVSNSAITATFATGANNADSLYLGSGGQAGNLIFDRAVNGGSWGTPGGIPNGEIFTVSITANSGFDLVLNNIAYGGASTVQGSTALITVGIPGSDFESRSRTYYFASLPSSIFYNENVDPDPVAVTIAEGTTLTLRFGANSGSTDSIHAIDRMDFDYTATAIPEPGTLGLFGLSSAAILIIRRRLIM